MTFDPADAHRIARDFFAGLSAGDLPEALFAPDFAAWTTTGGDTPGARYRGGAALLASVFPDGYRFTIESLTAQEDRVVAEARGAGVLRDGEPFANRYVFVLRLSGGRIAAVAEHFDPRPVHATLMPAIRAAMAHADQSRPPEG